MEKRIGAAIILVESKENIQLINTILSNHSAIILGRQGIPVRERNISVISLVLEGTTDELSSLTGQLGKIEGITVKSVLAKQSRP